MEKFNLTKINYSDIIRYMKNTKNKPIRYFGEITKLSNGKYKVKFMQRLIGVNQHRRKWVSIDKTQFTKELNSHLVID